MKIISSDLKKGIMKVKVENLDDLWYLNQVIESKDIVKGRTFRKIKIGSEEQRKQNVARKAVFLAIEVERVEYSESLRISGLVREGPEDVPLGSYHTFNLEENSIIEIKKDWLKYQVDKIKEASKEAQTKIIICVHDREEAIFAMMKKYGFDILSRMQGNVARKADDQKVEGNFYKEIIKQIQDYDKRYELSKIIIGSPAFWKEDLMKELSDEQLKKKIILAGCSSVGDNGINEVIRRPETSEALKQGRISKEFKMVEKLLEEISKNNLASYGVQETKTASDSGAVETLLITDSFIQKSREEDNYKEIENIMKIVDKAKGDVMIISSEHDAGKKLNGLTGIAAILRFRIK